MINMTDEKNTLITGQLAQYYAHTAAEHERVYAEPERQHDLAQLRDSVSEALRGHKVLELACGSAYWTEAIARTAGDADAGGAPRGAGHTRCGEAR